MKLSIDVEPDSIVSSILMKDFELLGLDDQQRQAFLEVISFYTVHEDFVEWYAALPEGVFEYDF